MRKRLSGSVAKLGELYLWFEGKPFVILGVAAAITCGTMVALADSAGWRHVSGLMAEKHAWAWLGICFIAQVVAYFGYTLTVRDMARVDKASEMSMSEAGEAVVAGFGVFAATRTAGGFAVDYWAFQRAGASRRQAKARATGLGLLEYVILSIGALIAATFLYFRLDGYASKTTTLPALAILPCLAIGVFFTSPKRVARLTRPRKGAFKKWRSDFLGGALAVRRLLARREHWLGVIGNVLYWAGDILCLWAALQIVNVHLPVAGLVLAYSGGYVLTRRSLPAGGAGAVEVALTFALVWMGAPFARSLVGVVIYRLFNFWLPIVPALLLMPSVQSLRAEFEQTEQTV